MAVDVPIIVYPKHNEGKHSKKELEELTRKWKEKKAREGGNSKKINLNEFTRSNG